MWNLVHPALNLSAGFTRNTLVRKTKGRPGVRSEKEQERNVIPLTEINVWGGLYVARAPPLGKPCRNKFADHRNVGRYLAERALIVDRTIKNSQPSFVKHILIKDNVKDTLWISVPYPALRFNAGLMDSQRYSRALGRTSDNLWPPFLILLRIRAGE
jgi:hypothetical protein